jgi:hypothetical protein
MAFTRRRRTRKKDNHSSGDNPAMAARLKSTYQLPSLTEGVLEPLRGLSKLPFQRVDLFRNVMKLFLGERSGLHYLMSLAVRFSQRATDFRSHLIEFIFSGHSPPP